MSAAALVIVVISCAVFADRLALEQGLHRADLQARATADELAARFVNDAVRRGDPGEVVRLATVMEHRMLEGSLAHATLYAEDGLVLWSDSESIRPRRIALKEDVAALFGTRGSILVEPGEWAVRDGSEPENQKLIGVYAGAHDADGAPFVFEAHMTTAVMEADRDLIFRSLLPVVLAMMLLFLLATLPLVIVLATRVDRASRSQSDLLRRSVGALNDERRRVAQVLHDGVIQDLSAVGYLASTLANGAAEGKANSEQTSRAAERIATLIQDDLRQLRVIVGGLFPSEGEGDDLVAALGALRARNSERSGLVVDLDLRDVDDLDERTSRAVFLVVREALANVGKHARAGAVVVKIHRTDDNERIVITVTDDGDGLSGAGGRIDPAEFDSELRGDHLGLRLVSRELDELGGALQLADGPDGGVVLTAWIPLGTPG